MKANSLLVHIIAILFAFPFMGMPAQAASITIDVLTTFDYPGTDVVVTLPTSINLAGDIAGYYTDSSGVTRSFVRFHTGRFSPPIVDPNDTANLTQAEGINNSRTVSGWYLSGIPASAHSFFLSGGIFTTFDVSGAFNTYVDAINDVGDFAGTFDTTAQSGQGFLALEEISSALASRVHLSQTCMGLTTSISATGITLMRVQWSTASFATLMAH